MQVNKQDKASVDKQNTYMFIWPLKTREASLEYNFVFNFNF